MSAEGVFTQDAEGAPVWLPAGSSLPAVAALLRLQPPVLLRMMMARDPVAAAALQSGRPLDAGQLTDVLRHLDWPCAGEE